MKNKYLDYSEYLNRLATLDKMKSDGFEFINKKNTARKVAGITCLAIAVFPNGLGAIFYPLGFMLLGTNIIDLKHKYAPRYLYKFKRLFK